MSEIGNKALLRLTDTLLSIQDQQGTSAALETATVQPVIDIGRGLGWNPSRDIRRYESQPLAIGGTTGRQAPYNGDTDNTACLIGNAQGDQIVWAASSPSIGLKVLAAEALINFGSNPTESDRLVVQWWLGTQVTPNGQTYHWAKIAGGDIGANAIFLEAQTKQYRAAFTGPNSGGDGTGGVSASGGSSCQTWRGWLAPPINALSENTGLFFGVSVEMWDAAGLTRLNFPANSFLRINGIIQAVPVGFMPIDL